MSAPTVVNLRLRLTKTKYGRHPFALNFRHFEDALDLAKPGLYLSVVAATGFGHGAVEDAEVRVIKRIRCSRGAKSGSPVILVNGYLIWIALLD